jgi:hypothetical protein
MRLVVDYFASRRFVVDYFTYTMHSVASARRTARRAAHRRLIGLLRASGCLGTSRGSSCGLSSTTSTTPRIQLLRHVARHVARLITPLVVDYFTSRRLVDDYFASAARPGASARRADRRAARRRLLRLRRASGCFSTSRGTSRGSSRRLSSTTSPRVGSSTTTSPPPCILVPRHVARLVVRLVVDYFDYAARLVASARRTTRHVARHTACRRLLRAPRLRLAATLALI